MGTGTPVTTGQTIQAAKMNLKLESIGDIGQLPNRWTRPSRIYASDGTTLKQKQEWDYTKAVSPANGDRIQCFLVGDGTETKISISTLTSESSGIFDLYINGSLKTSGLDNYNPTLSSFHRELLTSGLVVPGTNMIELRVNGKNASSTGYNCATYAISIY